MNDYFYEKFDFYLIQKLDFRLFYIMNDFNQKIIFYFDWK